MDYIRYKLDVCFVIIRILIIDIKFKGFNFRREF